MKLHLDPRTKLFLILLCVLSAMFAPNLYFQFALVTLIGLLAAFSGKWQYALRGMIAYALICVFTVWCMGVLTGTWRTMLIAFLGLVHKVYACGMLAGELTGSKEKGMATYGLVFLLPTVMEYNAPCTGEKYREIARAMGVEGVDAMSRDEYRKAAVDAVAKLSVDVGIPTTLPALKEEDLPFLAESAYADACRPGNPKDTNVEDLKALFLRLKA